MALDGRIFFLQGSCPNVRFVVSWRQVRTDQKTEFKKGRCTDLRNGDRVQVRGVVQADGVVAASRVEIRKDDD